MSRPPFNPEFHTGGRVTRKIRLDSGYTPTASHEVVDLAHANTICSDTSVPGIHRPVIDLDVGIRAIPTSTDGHYHLYIEQDMPWDDYVKLLDVLVEVGLVEEGYVNASLAHGYTVARLPWVRKGDSDG